MTIFLLDSRRGRDGVTMFSGINRLTYKAQMAKKYTPNGERECARRVRQAVEIKRKSEVFLQSIHWFN